MRNSFKMVLTNLTASPVDKALLEKIARETLKKINRQGEIGVVLVGEGRMQKLNGRYRGENRATDVLAFPYQDVSAARGLEKNAPVHPEAATFLGEVVICLPAAKKQARRAGHSFEKELAMLFVHGILHVCGYDHERSEEDAKIMFGLQEKILAKLKMKNEKGKTTR